MPIWLQWSYLLFWILLITLMSIGGYFMFRKFLKRLPKADGKSVLDWQAYHIDQTLHLWTDEHKALLGQLVAPVPQLFRHIAKQTIASKIGEIALKRAANELTTDIIITGYILATPKRDHRWLIKTLRKNNIDISNYQHLL